METMLNYLNWKLDIRFPENEAGGIGKIELLAIEDKKIYVETKSYGCNYNHPYIRENYTTKALYKLGYKFVVEQIN